MPSRPLLNIPVIALLLLLTALPREAAPAQPAFFLRDFVKSRLIIDTKQSGCVLFDVYVAQSAEQRSQGLMHIESLDKYEGMIFLYPQEGNIAMWMKNTLIPLDMFFIGRNSRVKTVHRNAVPMSEDIIESGGLVVAVLELNGGSADYFGIDPGDRIIFPAG